MEMCYDGALVMPSSYAVMNDDEMTYVDGGIRIQTWILSTVIDVAVTAAFGGAAASSIGWLLGKGMSKVVNALVRGGTWYCALLRNALGNGMSNFISSKLGMVGVAIGFTSVGGAIMNLWDIFDNSRINGYVTL